MSYFAYSNERMMRNKLDWILFDADHTLFDFDRSSRVSLKSALDESGIVHTQETIEDYFEINRACWRAFEEGKIDRETLTSRRFELFFKKIGVTDIDILGFNDCYLGHLPRHPYFLEGAPQVLDTLGQFFRMGIITNGLQQVQRPRLLESGVNHHFDVIVVSGEIGLAKPDPAYFEYAHQEMDMPAKDRVLVVGDNLYSDIHGGANYGFRTCWYNPAGKELTDDISPDHVVSSHTDLIALLLGEQAALSLP